MPNPNLTPENLGKFQTLIAKNPIAFTTAVFFVMFAFTYGINIAKNNDAEQYWKELYLKERDKNDALQMQLLIKAGVLEKAKEVIIEADSTLKQNTAKQIENLKE